MDASPPERGTVNVDAIVREVPTAIVPSAHGNAVTQSPLFETNVNPGGAGSASTTETASDGPALLTVMT